MSSFGSKMINNLLKIGTFYYRKNHLSLSSNIQFKNKNYKPNKKFKYKTFLLNGTKIEMLSQKNSTENDFAIVQFHGGGCAHSMNNLYRKVAERLCNLSGVPVYSIDYYADKNLTYPSVHNECYNAYLALLKENLNGKKIITIGDSFGANVMLSTCIKLRDINMPLPDAIISICCCIDLAATGSSYEKNCYRDPLYSLPKNQSFKEHEKDIRRIIKYIGNSSPYDKYLSPAYADYFNFPQMLIQCGDAETSESDNDMLYEKATQAGVDVTLTKYKDMWHDFQYVTPFLKDSKMAWREISDFIKTIMQKT